MDLNRKIKIGKFLDVKTNKIFYYPIIKKIRKNTWMVAIWYGNNHLDLSIDTFIIGSKEYQLLEEYNFGTKS